MKQIITLALSLIFTINYAQTTTIFDDVSNSSGLAIEGDKLYIAAFIENSIYQLDWTEPNPTASVLVEDIYRPKGIAIHGDYLYVSSNAIYQVDDKIVRINITQPNPVVEDFISITNPSGIVFRDDEMYVAAYEGIYQIDMNSSNPTPQKIIEHGGSGNFGIIGLCIVDNYLIMPSYEGIAKYDIDQPNPTSEIVPLDFGNIYGISNYSDKKVLILSLEPGMRMIYELDIDSGNYSPLTPIDLISPYDIVTNSDDLVFVSK
jgi:hypothetical protein